jgi:hypothetical protein
LCFVKISGAKGKSAIGFGFGEFLQAVRKMRLRIIRSLKAILG